MMSLRTKQNKGLVWENSVLYWLHKEYKCNFGLGVGNMGEHEPYNGKVHGKICKNLLNEK